MPRTKISKTCRCALLDAPHRVRLLKRSLHPTSTHTQRDTRRRCARPPLRGPDTSRGGRRPGGLAGRLVVEVVLALGGRRLCADPAGEGSDYVRRGGRRRGLRLAGWVGGGALFQPSGKPAGGGAPGGGPAGGGTPPPPGGAPIGGPTPSPPLGVLSLSISDLFAAISASMPSTLACGASERRTCQKIAFAATYRGYARTPTILGGLLQALGTASGVRHWWPRAPTLDGSVALVVMKSVSVVFRSPAAMAG